MIEDFVNIPPTAQGANKSQSKVKASSMHVILLSLMASSFNLSISDIKTFAPAPARYSASFFPTLPAPWIAIFFPCMFSDKCVFIACSIE